MKVGAAIAVAANIMNITPPWRLALRCQGSVAQISGRAAGCQGARAQISPSGPMTRPGHIQLHSQLVFQKRRKALSSSFGQAQPNSMAISPRLRRRVFASWVAVGHIQPSRLASHPAPRPSSVSRGSGHTQASSAALRLRAWARSFLIASTLIGVAPHRRRNRTHSSLRRALAVPL
ncbi:MAG: hypothetical protein EPO51_20690 [Phenylobacterium sp.]|nr:MAG: hypothetical protein EPO51_20690 [Phenylobacterium sp.]